jgi:hypothetical protein
VADQVVVITDAARYVNVTAALQRDMACLEAGL